MLERIVRAIRLDWTVFREIAQDPNAMKQAAIIVAIVTFLSAVGSGIANQSFVSFIVTWLVAILIGWIGWAVITYLVGTALFKGETNIPEMMRVLGYANAPHLLGLFSFIPCVGWIIAVIGWVLALVAGIIAVREAMDFDTGNAIVTVVISWVIAFAIRAVFWAFVG
ncbi:MAG TPA: YIP1 family protein [Anaerolineae bacterium]|nr:YIP1 family protein [Anaerolineae bacterium]